MAIVENPNERVLGAKNLVVTSNIEKPAELHLITIRIGSASKLYDGTPLTCNEYKIECDVPTCGVEVIITGSQTLVGSSENFATYRLYDANGYYYKDYIVDIIPGTLTVYNKDTN